MLHSSCREYFSIVPFKTRSLTTAHLLAREFLLHVIVVLLHPIHQLADVGVVLNVKTISVVAGVGYTRVSSKGAATGTHMSVCAEFSYFEGRCLRHDNCMAQIRLR